MWWVKFGLQTASICLPSACMEAGIDYFCFNLMLFEKHQYVLETYGHFERCRRLDSVAISTSVPLSIP